MALMSEETRVGVDPVQDKQPPYYTRGALYGVVAGILMGLYTWILNASTDNPGAALQFAKYIFLIAILGFVLYRHKFSVPRGKTFKTGIVVGAYTTIAAGITLIIFNIILYLGGADDSATEMFNKDADTLPDTLMLSGILFLETFVAGMITTFISLQLYKEPKTAE